MGDSEVISIPLKRTTSSLLPESIRRMTAMASVAKSNGIIYWYGLNGDVLDESDGSGNITNEYVFLGGKRIAWIAVR